MKREVSCTFIEYKDSKLPAALEARGFKGKRRWERLPIWRITEREEKNSWKIVLLWEARWKRKGNKIHTELEGGQTVNKDYGKDRKQNQKTGDTFNNI